MYSCKIVAAAAAVIMACCAVAQTPVAAGGGSYASAPPFYKAKTTPGGPGFNATAMLTREIFADERAASFDGNVEVPGRALPTNDWWTDIINNRYSGALWSYPAMLKTSDEGVQINWPSYWADAGKEIKSRTNLTMGAARYRADAAIAADWHDWDVTFRMPAKSGGGEMKVTAAHGSPFTWIEFTGGIEAEIKTGSTARLFGTTASYTGIDIDGDLYGVYFPAGSLPMLAGGKLAFGMAPGWLSVALLRTEADLAAFAPYAASIPRDTRVEWSYDEGQSRVDTRWTVTAENLRDAGAQAPVLQGFLPHAYKYALAGATFGFVDNEGFTTPRGRMKLGASASGTFAYSYRFSGMLPTYAAPHEGDAAANGYRPEVMESLMADYASRGSFGGDTYWGGKGLVQMAMNMSFAKETGATAIYEESKRRLREAFENWLTYTPGEDTFFFSYYPRWGAMLGFDVSYDSDAFNDHHFHYGYFTYAAALLCLEDKDFAERYGELLTMIAKDYANWDRTDGRFPFMRTLDPWCGHSWAGGLGDHGNDNGNGQESTSEAMQSWGGLYLLGVALGNKEMRDAGIWGWSTEARATREYWYDVDAPRPANGGGRKAWAGKGERQANYNYDEYPYAYNSNITGKGIGWWTWFGGDPLFMHGIQWMPVSPALDYLQWDADFTAWAFDDMMRGANSTFSHSWFETTYNSDNGEAIDPLANNDWGNVALTYLERSDPAEAARIFDTARERGMHIATAVSTSHITYYVIHSHLTYGEPDFDIHADVPTAQVRTKDGVRTYIVYNPGESDRQVHFYDASGSLVKTVKAPAGRLAAISADAVPSGLEVSVEGGNTVPPGEAVKVSVRVVDQYGAAVDDAETAIRLQTGAPAQIRGNILSINANAASGSRFALEASCGDIKRSVEITVNERPTAQTARVEGVPEICEKGVAVAGRFTVTDQYGNETTPDDTEWTLTSPTAGARKVTMPFTVAAAGKYTVTAQSATAGKEASVEVFITPPMPCISTGAEVAASSAENVGTMPTGGCDGDSNTRWGSAHTDSEWFVADLGEDCLVSRIDILWEAAYAARYELQVAPAGCEMQTLTVNYAGGTQTVRVPAENAWTTAAIETASGAGHRMTVLNASGRYVRMKGTERGSAYGYSMYEMSVFGLRGSLADDAVLGIDFVLPQTIDRGTPCTLDPKAYTRGGDTLADIEATWSADKNATFAGNSFVPRESGHYTLTASLGGGAESSATTFVNDVERAATVEVGKDTWQAIQGVPLTIAYKVMNQFMAPYSGDGADIDISVTDAEGATSGEAVYDAATQTFTGHACGRYTIDFGGLAQCTVNVLPIEEVNLALGKTAWDSSHENDGLTAAHAVDGQLETRWGSTFNDEEWMVVDLGAEFVLDHVNIYWNNPAYATHYTVATSLTGYDDDFAAVATIEGYTRTPEPVRIDAADRQARYVKLTGHRRSTGYGTSVDELEVYGRSYVTGVESARADDAGERWYTIQGIAIGRPTAAGVYIKVSGGKATKEAVR